MILFHTAILLKKFKVNNKEQHYWRRSAVFIFNFEHISHLFSSVSITDLIKLMFAGMLF